MKGILFLAHIRDFSRSKSSSVPSRIDPAINALRQFVAKVHPDRLIASHPKLALQNEQSLQALNGHLDDISRGSRDIKSQRLIFHILKETGGTRSVTVPLNSTNLIEVVRSALMAADLPTDRLAKSRYDNQTRSNNPWPSDLDMDISPFMRKRNQAFKKAMADEASKTPSQAVTSRTARAFIFANADVAAQRKKFFEADYYTLVESAENLKHSFNLKSLTFDENLSQNVGTLQSTRASLLALRRLHESMRDNARGQILLQSLVGQDVRLGTGATQIDIDGTFNFCLTDPADNWVRIWSHVSSIKPMRNQCRRLNARISSKLCGAHLAGPYRAIPLQEYLISLRNLADSLQIEIPRSIDDIDVPNRCVLHKKMKCEHHKNLRMHICNESFSETRVLINGQLLLNCFDKDAPKSIQRLAPIVELNCRRHEQQLGIIETLRARLRHQLQIAALLISPRVDPALIIDCLNRWSEQASILFNDKSKIVNELGTDTSIFINSTLGLHADGTVQLPHSINL